MDLFDGLDWTQCQLLNVIPVRAVADPQLLKSTGSTTFYQLGVKFHGQTLINYNGEGILFNTGSILYLPKETEPDIPYNKRIIENGEGVCIFFDSPVPLAKEPALFPAPGNAPGTANAYPLNLFSKLEHAWRMHENPLLILSYFTQILAHLYRCTQTQPQKMEMHERLAPAIQWLDENCYTGYPDPNHLAKLCGLSSGYFRLCFQQTFHVTALQYLHNKQMQLAKELLAGTDLTVVKIAHQCGFDSNNYFARFFREHVGVSPTEYRQMYGKAL